MFFLFPKNELKVRGAGCPIIIVEYGDIENPSFAVLVNGELSV
jgi:hypothetical protein